MYEKLYSFTARIDFFLLARKTCGSLKTVGVGAAIPL